MIKVMIGKEEVWIKGEKAQWTIGKKSIVKTGDDAGKETFTGEWFYPTLEGMLKNILERKVRCAEANTLIELREAIMTAKDELMGMYDMTLPMENVDEENESSKESPSLF